MKNLIIISAAILALGAMSCKKTNTDHKVATYETTLNLTVSSPALTRAAVSAENGESNINTATAFVFRGTTDNALLDRAPFAINSDGAETAVKVTSEAQAIYVVANATGADFSAVTNLGELKSLTADLFDGETLTQNSANLIMWGVNTIDKTNPEAYTSNVVMRFAPSKVNFLYHVAADQTSQLVNPELVVIYAQGKTTLVPAGEFAPSKVDGHFAMMPAPEQLNYYSGVSFDGSEVRQALKIENATSQLNKTFYLFENTSNVSTIIAVRGFYNGVMMYYPIHFSSSDNGNATFESILAGKIYNIEAKINHLAGGTTDPTKPVSQSTLNVTIVPAQWYTSVSWIKEFN